MRLKYSALINFVFIVLITFFLLNSLHTFVVTDYLGHFNKVLSLNRGESAYPPNFLFYFLVAFLSGFTTNINIITQIGFILLSAAIGLKFLINREVIKSVKNIKPYHINLLSYSLLFVFVIPVTLDGHWYLGRLVPNIWHNSTIIFQMPLAIYICFWLHKVNYFDNYKIILKQTFILTILLIVNISIKPSFAFVLIPSALTYLGYKTIFSKQKITFFINKSIPFIISLLYIAFISVMIFIFQKGSFQDEPSSIKLCTPFELYMKWNDSLLLFIAGLFSSLIIPILAFTSNCKNKELNFTWLMLLYAIAIAGFVIESGPRYSHGNFTWQVIPALYLLYMFSLKAFLLGTKTKTKTIGMYMFYIQSIVGILYILRFFIEKTYL